MDEIPQHERAGGLPSTSRDYSNITLGGHTHAVFGDVNVDSRDFAFIQHADPKQRKKLLLRSLYFPHMDSRKEHIAERASSPKFIEWVWNTNFVHWLEGPKRFYWITGRPGSGKSTLMSHISNSVRTKESLRRNGNNWKVVSFFFDFRAGSELANTIEGMLRSLLYQIIRQVPEVMQAFDDDYFEANSPQWTLHGCLSRLCEAVEASAFNICAFIDGLDEYHGSYLRLVEAIHVLEERVLGIKLCLASRPYSAFRDDFDSFDSLIMQEHNEESIKMYTSAQWSNHRIDDELQLPRELSEEIRAKANGVFLWARLAVDELVVDLLAGKHITKLREQLNEMPTEVEAMYHRALDRLPESQRQEAAAILFIMIQTSWIISVTELYVALEALQLRGRIGKAIMPIDCGADNTRRLSAILGDLTDQRLVEPEVSVNRETDYTRCAYIVLDGSALKFARPRDTYVVLTHQTLSRFLEKSVWLQKNIAPNLIAKQGHDFWSDIYLSEIASKLSSKNFPPSDRQAIHRLIQERLADQQEAVAALVESWFAGVDLNQVAQDYSHGTEHMKTLEAWPCWSPLMLHALGNLFNAKLDMLKHDDIVKYLCGSPVILLHISVCIFRGLDTALCKLIEARKGNVAPPLRATAPHECYRLAHLLPRSFKPHSYLPSGTELISCAIAHSCDEKVPILLKQLDLPHDLYQTLFDYAWASFSTRGWHGDEKGLQKRNLLEYFLSVGCELAGSHLCLMTSEWPMTFYTPIGALIKKYLSSTDFSHTPGCGQDTRKINLLRECVSVQIFSHEEIQEYKDRIEALLDRGSDINEIHYFTGKTLLTDLIYRGETADPRAVRVMLEVGADPYKSGGDGENAYHAANTILESARLNNDRYGIHHAKEILAVLDDCTLNQATRAQHP